MGSGGAAAAGKGGSGAGTGGGSGTAGTGVGTGGASGSGSGGTPSNGGGAGATGGSAGTGGAGGANVGGMAGTSLGGSAGTEAGAGPGGGQAGASAGMAGMAGLAGAGGGSGLHGGASGKFICPGGATYGNPLTGMGSVAQIGPPTQGTPNYFGFVEGPVWVASLGKLFFSDNSSPERIWVLTPGSEPKVFLDMSKSNGMALDGDDQLVVANQVDNSIQHVDPAASAPAATLITAAGCKPNDVIVRSDGNIYYTAPQQAGTGFYRLSPSQMRTGPRTDVTAPNGIVLSPDENTLYVGDVQNKKITKFAVDADGVVGATATPFATAMSGTVDGMCVDCAGNVYAGTANGVEVYSPDGMLIGTVPTGESSNCTFGGTDRKTMYVTSRSVIKTVTLAVPGLPD
jgi:gluconolactonase